MVRVTVEEKIVKRLMDYNQSTGTTTREDEGWGRQKQDGDISTDGLMKVHSSSSKVVTSSSIPLVLCNYWCSCKLPSRSHQLQEMEEKRIPQIIDLFGSFV